MESPENRFKEKCEGILAIAKKKKNVLDYQEIMNYFQDSDFEADRMEKVFEFLETNKVDVKMNDDVDEDEDIILDDEEEILKTICIFRLVLPKTLLRYAGGRTTRLSKYNQKLGLIAGINSMLVGNYLTTTGSKSEEDQKMLEQLDLVMS